MAKMHGVAAGMALALALQATTGQAASLEAGRKIAVRNCGMCPAIGVRGESRNPLSPPFRTLSARYPVEMLAEALAEGIRTGHPAMPEFRFSAAEIDDLIAYIKSVQTLARARAASPERHVALAYAGGPSSR